MPMQKLAILIVAAALFAGCARQTQPDDETAGMVEPADEDFVTQPLTEDELFGDGRPLDGEFGAIDAPEAVIDQGVIYFDFDSSSIRPEYSDTIAAHADRLVDDSAQVVRLEGHTDERGSREYNIGLGERRSQAVRQALMLQGVRGDQIVTVSYGEEQPAMSGDDEEAWALNHRVEIVYLR